MSEVLFLVQKATSTQYAVKAPALLSLRIANPGLSPANRPLRAG
jgi:hypothetical protein